MTVGDQPEKPVWNALGRINPIVGILQFVPSCSVTSDPSNPSSEHGTHPNRVSVVRRSILQAWRELTGGSQVPDQDRPTLLACSGGADSCALVIALTASMGLSDEIGQPVGHTAGHTAQRGGRRGCLAVGHIVHDLRPQPQAHADRDCAKALAARLGLEFYETSVQVRSAPGNAEANARHARYQALANLAADAGCRFVATAHHADDQTETVLMAAARGAGLKGLAGMHASRALNPHVTLVRPMLSVHHADALALCEAYEWVPAHDETNDDTTRVRARVRHNLLGAITQALPMLPTRLVETTELLREADRLIELQAEQLWTHASVTSSGITWSRDILRQHSWLVVATHLRAAHIRLLGGRGADRLSLRLVRQVAQAIQDSSGHHREYAWWGVVVHIQADAVDMRLCDERILP